MTTRNSAPGTQRNEQSQTSRSLTLFRKLSCPKLPSPLDLETPSLLPNRNPRSPLGPRNKRGNGGYHPHENTVYTVPHEDEEKYYLITEAQEHRLLHMLPFPRATNPQVDYFPQQGEEDNAIKYVIRNESSITHDDYMTVIQSLG